MINFLRVGQLRKGKGITTMRVRLALMLAIGGAVMLGASVFPKIAHAQPPTPLGACADLIAAGEYIVTNNISSPGATCFQILADDITLDCNNRTIAGDGTPLTRGIYLIEVSNVTVKNCTIDNFQLGIQDSSGSVNTLERNRVRNNTDVGIYVAGSVGDLLISNTVDNNGPAVPAPGIAIDGGGSHHLLSNTAKNNVGGGINLNTTSGNELINNAATGNTQKGILGIDADNNDFIGNRSIANGEDGIHLSFGSDNNSLDGNIAIKNVEFGIDDNAAANSNTHMNNKCAGNVLGGSDPAGLCSPQP